MIYIEGTSILWKLLNIQQSEFALQLQFSEVKGLENLGIPI